MRRCYLVFYDIRDSKRLHRVFKTLKGDGEHWQLSVFFCVIKDIDSVRLQGDLENIMNLKEDQALIVDMGPNEQSAREKVKVIGQGLAQVENEIIVV